MGSDGPGPSERQARRQGAQTFAAGFSVVDLLSGLIQSALSGDVGRFESMPLAQRRASSARATGARNVESTRRQLASNGLEKTSAGQAQLQTRTLQAKVSAIL
jgi:hypothetical protein